MRAFDLIIQTPWAITEDALRQMLEIATRENLSPQAVAAQLGRPLDYTRTVKVRDGVATIPVDGPIFRRANLFTEISGATSVEVLATDFHTALHDPAVASILFEIDSPGGEAAGVHEFANMVYAARGQKPITAYVSDLGASAAYWIASAADEIVADDAAFLGSIGVVAAVPDPTKRNAREIEFVSSQSPKKRADPTTEAGRTQIQRMVDDLADVFIGAVARNRGVTAETVLERFGAGGLLIGRQAVEAGLADRLGSFESTVTALSQRPRTKERAMADWKAMFKGMFSAMDEIEGSVPQAGADAAPHTGDTGAPAEAVPGTADAETIRLRKLLADEQQRRFTAEAEAFYGRQLAAGRALPAEELALQAAYIRAATDDAEHGGPSRVAMLTALVDARPAHALTQELVPAASDATVLTNKTTSSDDDLEAAKASARKFAEQRNGHAAGKES